MGSVWGGSGFDGYRCSPVNMHPQKKQPWPALAIVSIVGISSHFLLFLTQPAFPFPTPGHKPRVQSGPTPTPPGLGALLDGSLPRLVSWLLEEEYPAHLEMSDLRPVCSVVLSSQAQMLRGDAQLC